MLIKLTEKIDIDDILLAIARSNDEELSQIINAIIQTYSNRYPDEEMIFLSLPQNNPHERKRILDALYGFICKH